MTQCLIRRIILTPMTFIRLIGTDGQERALMKAVPHLGCERSLPMSCRRCLGRHDSVPQALQDRCWMYRPESCAAEDCFSSESA